MDNSSISIDTALDEGHLKGAVAYKRLTAGEYVLVYQHPQKDGFYFGTRAIHCYEFELSCLGFRPHPPHRSKDGRPAQGAGDAGRLPALVPARPHRFNPERAGDNDGAVLYSGHRVRI